MKNLILGLAFVSTVSAFAEEKTLFRCEIDGTDGYGKAIVTLDKEKGTYSYKTKFNEADEWSTFFETRESLVFLTNADATGYVEYYDFVYQPEMILSTIRIDINTDFSAQGSGEHFTPYGNSTYSMTKLQKCQGGHEITL